MMLSELLRGVVLIVVSILLAVATLGLWFSNMETSPVISWLVFVVGFAISAVSAIAGIWGILATFKDKEEG
jgi:sugar phosphate permease